MKHAINIESKATKKAVESLTDGIDKIFKSAHENLMDQETVKKALEIMESAFSIKGTTITNSTFNPTPNEK